MFDLSKFSLKGKITIVTGGGRGIGKAIAGGMAKAGAWVIITSRTIKELEETADEINAAGGNVFPLAADISKLESVEAVVKNVIGRFGRIDILVNNAAAAPLAPMLDADERHWDNIMNLNMKGTFFLSQACAKVMSDKGGGKIINIASIDGCKAEPNCGVYSISKAGIRMMTKAFACELASSNIRVNTIMPGPVDTKILDLNFEGLPPEEAKARKDAVARWTPLGRIADPDEIAGAAIYLASDASSFTTGAEIVIDGGVLMKW